MAQWFRLHASTAGGMSLIPGQGTKDPTCCTAQPKEKKKRERERERVTKEGLVTSVWNILGFFSLFDAQ